MTIVEANVMTFPTTIPIAVDARVAQHLDAERGARAAALVGTPVADRAVLCGACRPPCPLLLFPLRPLPPGPCPALKPTSERSRGRSARAAGRRPRGGPRAPRAERLGDARWASRSASRVAARRPSPSQTLRGTRRPQRRPAHPLDPHPEARRPLLPRGRVADLLELRVLEGRVDAGELEDPPQRRHPVVAQVAVVEHEDLLLGEVLEEALQLHEVLAAGDVGGVRVKQRLAQVALLAALGEVVDAVRRDPLDRVADDVDELRRRERPRRSARARRGAAGRPCSSAMPRRGSGRRDRSGASTTRARAGSCAPR